MTRYVMLDDTPNVWYDLYSNKKTTISPIGYMRLSEDAIAIVYPISALISRMMGCKEKTMKVVMLEAKGDPTHPWMDCPEREEGEDE